MTLLGKKFPTPIGESIGEGKALQALMLTRRTARPMAPFFVAGMGPPAPQTGYISEGLMSIGMRC